MLLLVACKHKIHEGIITSKTYEPPRTYTYYTTVLFGKTTILMPHTGYDDEDFIFTVVGIDKQKDTIVENFYVSKSTFNCMNIGDHFIDTIPCETEDKNQPYSQNK